jgi:nucleolysin TIA-1/TIAR
MDCLTFSVFRFCFCFEGEFLGSRAIRVNWASQKNEEKAAPVNTLSYEMILAQSPSFNTTVYVGNITPDTTRKLLFLFSFLFSFFSSFFFFLFLDFSSNLVIFQFSDSAEQQLYPLFVNFGYIVEVRMQADKGYAFFKFDTHESAAAAIYRMTGEIVNGRPLKVSS